MEIMWILIIFSSVVVLISAFSQSSAKRQVDKQMNQIMHNEVVIDEVRQNNPNCPVQVDKVKITVPQGWNFPCCWVQFRNVGEKPVASVNYDVICFDSFGTPVGEPPANISNVSLQDEQAGVGAMFGFEKYIALPKHPTTRKANIRIRKVLYSDGSLWELDDESATKLA